MEYVTKKFIANTSEMVLEKLSLEITPSLILGKFTKDFLEAGHVKSEKYIDYTYHIAKELPHGAYTYEVRKTVWGDPQGNNISTMLEPDGTYSTIFDVQDNVAEQIFRDAQGNVSRRTSIPWDYDPRTRPWYKLAVEAKQIVWTDIYYNLPFNNPTVTLAIPIYDQQHNLKGVFGIETKLVGLSQYLSNLDLRNGTAFIFNDKGELVAFPGMNKELASQSNLKKLDVLGESGKPWLADALKFFRKTNEKSFTFKYEGDNYIASFERIPQFKQYGWMIGVVVPEKDFIGSLKRANRITTAICFIILLLGIMFTYYFSRRISDPIKSLVQETEKIKMFVLDNTPPQDSIIKEVHQLSSAIYSMKINLHSFEKYIPQNLVRQLIQSGEDSYIGGTERILTIFFSDIQAFTWIGETMKPKELMEYLCTYLEELSSIIIESGGTIDKYIGDSIMAFWGAPLTDEQHCRNTCLAALKCQQRLEKLNKEWEQQGKIALITRIGIHIGKVIVGNIGSSERLNYTVLGDSVNLASRLEKINKLYGTKVLVSDKVINTMGDSFVYRLVDHITVRGKTISYYIYELLAEAGQTLHFDLVAYNEYFAQAFKAYTEQQWDTAIALFNNCLEIYSDDTLVPVFIERCQQFKLNPPPVSWDGTWVEL